jgi:hypothetical protein
VVDVTKKSCRLLALAKGECQNSSRKPFLPEEASAQAADGVALAAFKAPVDFAATPVTRVESLSRFAYHQRFQIYILIPAIDAGRPRFLAEAHQRR